MLDKAWLQINSGAFDYNTAIRTAVKDLTNKGIKSIEYPSGHTDYLDTAVRRATVTGVNQTALKLQDTLAAEMGCNLFDVTAYSGARNTGTGLKNHAEWQGKRYYYPNYDPDYPSLVEATGYGTGEGLGGWNCRHSFFPYFEGMEQVYTQTELDEMNAPKYEYNGEKLTEYEATQKQRGIERNIRKWKREYIGMKASGQPTDEAAAKLAKWRGTQKDFIEQTKLEQQYNRESIVGFNRKESVDATKRAERYYEYWSKSMGVNESVKTLANYYEMKYNNTEEYVLLKRYVKDIESGWISPNADFGNYSGLYHRIQNEIVGQTTSNGIVIIGQSRHFMQRVLGTSEDPITKRLCSGVEIDDIIDALFVENNVGKSVTRSDGLPSVKFTGRKCAVSVNPESGILIVMLQ